MQDKNLESVRRILGLVARILCCQNVSFVNSICTEVAADDIECGQRRHRAIDRRLSYKYFKKKESLNKWGTYLNGHFSKIKLASKFQFDE
jgi:hypothetical protein